MPLFGELLRAVLEDRFGSIAAAAAAVGLERSNLSAVVAGRRPPRDDAFERWLAIWGVDQETAGRLREALHLLRAGTAADDLVAELKHVRGLLDAERKRASAIDEDRREAEGTVKILRDTMRSMLAAREDELDRRRQVDAQLRDVTAERDALWTQTVSLRVGLQAAQEDLRRLALQEASDRQLRATISALESELAALRAQLSLVRPVQAAEQERRRRTRSPRPDG